MCIDPFTIATVGAAWKVVRKVKKNADLLDEVQEMLLPTIQHYTPIVLEITSQAKTQGMSTEPHIAPVLAKFEVALQFLQEKYDELYPDGEEEVSLATQFNRDRKGSKAHDEIMKARSNLAEYEKTLRHYLSEKLATVSAPPPPCRSTPPVVDTEPRVTYRSIAAPQLDLLHESATKNAGTVSARSTLSVNRTPPPQGTTWLHCAVWLISNLLYWAFIIMILSFVALMGLGYLLQIGILTTGIIDKPIRRCSLTC